MKLPLDTSRCTGMNCSKKQECLRFTDIPKCEGMTNSEKLTLSIVTLMRTFLSSYEDDKKKYDTKIPRHVQKLLNRVVKGMYLANKNNSKDYKDVVNIVNVIYLDAIDNFKEKDVVIEVVDICMRLYLLDDVNLQNRYYISDKQMELLDRRERSSELKHEQNAFEIVDFFEKRLFKEFDIPMKKKFKLSMLIK